MAPDIASTPGASALPAVILISGRGTNLDALIRAIHAGQLNLDIRSVISNVPDAPGLEIARSAGIPGAVIDHKQFPDRVTHEADVGREIDRFDPALIVLAGYMRILSDDFVRQYEGRMINLHPSLLPLYPGLETHARVLESGDCKHGASVHFVTPELDSGPVIAQVQTPVLAGDTAAGLAERLLPLEHRLLVASVELFCAGRVEYRDGRVSLDGHPRSTPLNMRNGETLDFNSN